VCGVVADAGRIGCEGTVDGVAEHQTLAAEVRRARGPKPRIALYRRASGPVRRLPSLSATFPPVGFVQAE
jgi:hypothetical protein